MKAETEHCLLSGQSLAEYQKMFALNSADLNKKVLVCASGFANDKPIEWCVSAALPQLPFKDYEFALALSANFLFSAHEDDLEFHLAAVKEMCRVAKEARIFPLLDKQGEPSGLIAPLILQLQQQNYGIEIKEVDYQSQKGGNAMLRVWPQVCELK